MSLLRRVLYWQAAVWAGTGIVLAALPGPALEGLLGQPPLPGYGWVRVGGVQAFALALVMVLVAHRIEEVWWWSWAFVVAAAGLSTVAVISIALGLPAGAPALPWWLAALVGAAFAGALLLGLARTGQEKPPL